MQEIKVYCGYIFPLPQKHEQHEKAGKKKVMHQQPFPSAAMYLPVLLPEQAMQSLQKSAHCLPSLLGPLHNRSLRLGEEIAQAAVTPFHSLQRWEEVGQALLFVPQGLCAHLSQCPRLYRRDIGQRTYVPLR